MFHILTCFGAVLLFFALAWHGEPAKPIEIERRPAGQQPARRQTAEKKILPDPIDAPDICRGPQFSRTGAFGKSWI